MFVFEREKERLRTSKASILTNKVDTIESLLDVNIDPVFGKIPRLVSDKREELGGE